MADKSKRSKKKSKDYDSASTDEEVNTYVKKEMDKAMKQVNKAMKQAKLARKEGKKVREAARQFRGVDLDDDDDMEEDAEPTSYGDERGRDYRGQKGDKDGYRGKKEDGYSWSESKNGKAGNTYTQYNTVYHKGTMINIQNAQNVQVGHNNLMVVTDQRAPRTRKTSQPRDTAEEDRQREEEERRQREVEERFRDVFESERPATMQDFEKACTHITNWRRFMRNLDLSDAEIDHLHQDHYVAGVREVLIQGTRVWQQKTARGATLGAFANILKKVKQFDAIEVLKVNYK